MFIGAGCGLFPVMNKVGKGSYASACAPGMPFDPLLRRGPASTRVSPSFAGSRSSVVVRDVDMGSFKDKKIRR